VRAALGSLLKNHVYTPGVVPGNHVILESTPFGSSSLFLNSWSRGIVSAVTGSRSCAMLCDVHAAPGSEGGALYLQVPYMILFSRLYTADSLLLYSECDVC
jgi:hypothetical protein